MCTGTKDEKGLIRLVHIKNIRLTTQLHKNNEYFLTTRCFSPKRTYKWKQVRCLCDADYYYFKC